MAHSSGGGSSSDGCHSGSSSSSHSRGSGSSGQRYHTYKSTRPGCRSYVYHDKHNVLQTIYCDYDPSEPEKGGCLKWVVMLAYIPFLLFILPLLISSFRFWSPVPKI